MPEARESHSTGLQPRQLQTRSRNGCSTCKKRHRRCDEARPVCSNCSAESRECQYPVVVPLRERRAKHRALPGAQEVWAVTNSSDNTTPSLSKRSWVASRSSTPAWGTSWQLAPAATFEPFDVLAIRMPYKSAPLLSYYHQAADALGMTAAKTQPDRLATIVHDPASLRGFLLIAGLHYGWNYRNLQEYECTFLFHKVEAMRTINEGLQDTSTRTYYGIVKLIQTLCFLENCLMNIPAAEYHFSGLLAFMDLRSSETSEFTLQDEIINRHLLIIQSSILIGRIRKMVRNVLDDSQLPLHNDHTFRTRDEAPQDSIYFSLKTICLLPLFIATPAPDTVPRHINADPQIACMRALTCSIEATIIQEHLEWPAEGIKCNPRRTEGPVLQLGYEWVDSHAESLLTDSKPPAARGGFQSSWGGMTVSAMFYLNAVLIYTNMGQPLTPTMLQRMLRMINRDLKSEEPRISEWNTPEGDLWFWKAFVSAVAAARATGIREHEERLPTTRPELYGYVKRWAERTKTQSWMVARQALQRVVWPSGSLSESVAQNVWVHITTLSE